MNHPVQRVISGSATPGCDLMALVRRGVLTQEQADKAMREHSGGTALAAEAAEIAAMRRLDI